MRAALVAARLYGKARDIFRVVQYSLQRNHFHLICEARTELALARGMQGLNCRLAKAFNRYLARRGTFFADRYHAEPLRTPNQTRRALAYVLQNGRRHGEHLHERADWVDPFSSAAHFDGWHDRRPVPGPEPFAPEPVSPPTSWLLRIGWRRHGLVRIREIPGARTWR